MKYEKAKKRYAELLELLLKYAKDYYIDENPSVSDAIYDSLITELKGIEKTFPDLINPSSPTQRVAASASDEFKKVEHRYQMLSLNDVFSTQDIKDWITRTEKLLENQKHEYFMDIKMDGLACSLIYQDGHLIQAVTRGDGFVGEDVTVNVRTIKNIPLKLTKVQSFIGSYSGRVEVRGEIIMLKSDFDKLNRKRQKEGLALFANPRNLAAGTIRQLDPKLVADRPLRFMAWDLIVDDRDLIKTNMMAYELLSKIGIVRNKWASVASNIKEIDKFIDHWVRERPNLAFYIDGLVIKINDRQQFSKLGVVGKNPRGAVAYKFPAEEATTKIMDIQLSIGRTGAVTPIAVFNPVVLAGTTVRHASIHNSDEIERKDIRIGDTVVIYKAGDIIPQIDRVIKDLRSKGSGIYNFEANVKLQYPDLHFKRTKDEAVYRLIAKDAPYLIKKNIEHYASKPALDIDGLGEANVSLLVGSGLVSDVADLYLLKQEDVEKLDRFAELSSSNLITAINDKRTPILSKFIFGLGIRHVGAQTAVDLTNRFSSLKSLKDATEEELLSVEGIGEIVADSIIKWFADPENEKLLDKLKSVGVEPKSAKTSNKLKGYSIAITGTIEGMSREQIADKIRSLGGKFDSAVNNDTKYLIVGSSPGKSKIDRANELGIEKIEKNDLKQLFDTKD